MKRAILNLILVLSVIVHIGTVAAFSQKAPHLYKQVNTFSMSGDGGWDYLTYDPAANRVFVAHATTILVVDAGSGKQLGEIPATGAHGVALAPEQGRGFSTNGRAGTVTVFDFKSLKVTDQIKVGANPDAILYDPHSKRVIVMHGGSKDVMVIDPQSLKVIATIPLGGKLEFAATDDAHLYVNVEDTAEIAAIDTKNWKPAQRWKLEGCEEPSGLAIDRAAHRLFTVCGNKKMLVVDDRSGKIVATLPTGDGTDGAAFDPGLKLAFASNGEGTLTVVRAAKKGGGYEVAENVETRRGARTIALDPKSHKIFLATAEFGPPAEGQKRPSIKPGTFTMLVFAPAK